VICTWTPTGLSAVIIGDDFGSAGAGSPGKVRTKLEQLGGMGLEQVQRLAFGANPFRAMRGNVAGDCVFTARKSHADRATAMNYFKTNYGYIGQMGTLVLAQDAASLTMANATFRGVIVAEFNGLEWTLRYTFGMTTIT
jgi:hypothetical protein